MASVPIIGAGNMGRGIGARLAGRVTIFGSPIGFASPRATASS